MKYDQGQTKAWSMIEAVTNILVGVVIAFTSQLVIFHFYGIHISHTTNALMTLWFTIISLTRSFILRRVFNRITICQSKTTSRSTTATGNPVRCGAVENSAAIADSCIGSTIASGMGSSSNKSTVTSNAHMPLAAEWALE